MSHSKTSLFLMELIISILFFAFTGAVSAQMFLHSQKTAADSVDINHAIMWCESMADLCAAKEGNVEAAAKILSETDGFRFNPSEDHQKAAVFFNQDWEPITENSNPGTAVFKLSATLNPDKAAEGCVCYTVSVSRDGRALYSIEDIQTAVLKGGTDS